MKKADDIEAEAAKPELTRKERLECLFLSVIVEMYDVYT